MIESILESMVIGAAYRIHFVGEVGYLPEDGGLTGSQAFYLLASERGRLARYYAHELLQCQEMGVRWR